MTRAPRLHDVDDDDDYGNIDDDDDDDDEQLHAALIQYRNRECDMQAQRKRVAAS